MQLSTDNIEYGRQVNVAPPLSGSPCLTAQLISYFPQLQPIKFVLFKNKLKAPPTVYSSQN